MKLKIILIFLLSITFAHSQTNATLKSNISCSDLKVDEYYYNDKNTFKNGSIKLFSYKNGKRFDALNKLIMKNSEYILNIDGENEDLRFHSDSDTIFDYSKENIKFQNWVDRLDLLKIFTLNSESESYQKKYKEMSRESDETLFSKVFCLDKILVYNVKYTYIGDKGSPYYEYINIDLNNINLVDFNSLISIDKLDSFNKTIFLYAENHKKEIVRNYKKGLSEKADQLLVDYQNIFELSKYDSSKIKCKINSNDFYHFSPGGIVFNVNVKDKNFLLNKEDPRIDEYVSEIVIPYKEVINYLDKKNSLYSSINKQIATEIKN